MMSIFTALGIFCIVFCLNYYFLATFDDRSNNDARYFWCLIMSLGCVCLYYGLFI